MYRVSVRIRAEVADFFQEIFHIPPRGQSRGVREEIDGKRGQEGPLEAPKKVTRLTLR